jgi:hypothetical protein
MKHVTARDLRLDYGIDEWYGEQEEIRRGSRNRGYGSRSWSNSSRNGESREGRGTDAAPFLSCYRCAAYPESYLQIGYPLMD